MTTLFTRTLAVAAMAGPAHAEPVEPLAHTHEHFALVARAPFAEVAPLFGALRERDWAPDWDPQLIHPSPAADVAGMVFFVRDDRHESIWVNTRLDLERGVIQYVYVIPTKMTTLITVRLQAQARATRVEVEYERTALSRDANVHVRELARHDGASGPEWEHQINAYLKRRR